VVKLLVLLCAVCLSGCAVVEVQSQGAPPQLSVWPFGVQVRARGADALTVSGRTIGLGGGCQTAALGSCTYINPKTCGVAAIYNPSLKQLSLWGKIANETQARCLHKETKQ